MNFSKPRSNDDLVSDSRPLINLKHVRSQIFFNVKTDDDNKIMMIVLNEKQNTHMMNVSSSMKSWLNETSLKNECIHQHRVHGVLHAPKVLNWSWKLPKKSKRGHFFLFKCNHSGASSLTSTRFAVFLLLFLFCLLQ